MLDNSFGPDASAIVPLATRVAALATAVGASPAATPTDPDPIVRALLAAHQKLDAIAVALEEREKELALREARLLARERAVAACEDLRPILTGNTSKARLWPWAS